MIFTAEDVQKRLHTQPFIPLRIVTTTGETYDVHHPDLVIVGRRYVVVGFPDASNPKVFDQATQLALVHIVELRDLLARTTQGPNGSQTTHTTET